MANRRELAETWFQKGTDALARAFTSDYQSEFRSDMEEALEGFTHAVGLDRDHAEAWFQKGLAAARLDRHQEAAEAHRQAARLRPEDAARWLELGHALRVLEDPREALLAYQQVLQLRPGDKEAAFQRAAMLRALGRHEEALASWDELLQSASADSDEHITDARLYRAQALVAHGSPQEARSAFRDAFRLGWFHASGGFTRSSILDSLERFEEARDAYLEEVRARPEGAPWKRAGVAFLYAKRAAEALAAYDAAIAERPDDPDAWSGRAEALVQAGRCEEAVPAYEEALRLDPKLGYEARLRVVLRQLGRWDALRLLPSERQRTPVVHRPIEPWRVVTTRPEKTTGGRPAARPRTSAVRFDCAYCHAWAGSVHLENDVATIRGYAVRQPGDDSVQVTVASADQPGLLRALRAATAQALFEVDERYAPAYCSQCQKTYCLEHWTVEDSYPPETYHKCPADHIRSLYAQA